MGLLKKKIRQIRNRPSSSSESSLNQLQAQIAKQNGKDLCLDLGSGSIGVEDPDFTTIDINPKSGADYIGDIKYLFVDHFNKTIEDDYPSLMNFPVGHYQLIRAVHFIEHIPWIYHDQMFKWVFESLADGGAFWIGTPNLEFIAKIYIKNLYRIYKGKDVKYPDDGHSLVRKHVSTDMVKWVNYKIFSGQSPLDKHQAIYDKSLLFQTLRENGFNKISMFAGHFLSAVAYKPLNFTSPVDEAVRRAVGEK